MAIKIFVDTTGELVVNKTENGGDIERYPAFCEITRHQRDADKIIIKSITRGNTIVVPTAFGDIEDEGGTPYANYTALFDALTPYFDDVV